MSGERERDGADDAKKPENAAPDAVMDPNEKTEGHPGMGPTGGETDKDSDPGGG